MSDRSTLEDVSLNSSAANLLIFAQIKSNRTSSPEVGEAGRCKIRYMHSNPSQNETREESEGGSPKNRSRAPQYFPGKRSSWGHLSRLLCVNVEEMLAIF